MGMCGTEMRHWKDMERYGKIEIFGGRHTRLSNRM